jgi:hypothetical protein
LPRETVTANNSPSQAGSLTTYRITCEKYRITSHLGNTIILDAPLIFKRVFQGENKDECYKGVNIF